MARLRNFSIYLLKPGVLPERALTGEHGLDEVQSEKVEFEAGRFFVRGRQAPQPSWWGAFLGITPPTTSAGSDALAFIPIEDRWFVLSFGFGASKLEPEEYEHDFGINVATVLLDDGNIRSAASVEPDGGRRQVTQLPKSSPISALGLDSQASIVRALTGTVQAEQQNLYRTLTGGSNLKISSRISSEILHHALLALLQAYNNAEQNPEILRYFQIRPLTDPVIIEWAELQLIEAINNLDEERVSVSIPEMVDYGLRDSVKFSGLGSSEVFPDIYIGSLYRYINNREFTVENLRRSKLIICDDDGANEQTFALRAALVFEVETDERKILHLCEGSWYEFAADYIERIGDEIRPHFQNFDIIPFDSHQYSNEGDYNRALAASLPNALCMDGMNMLHHPNNQEPCDVLKIEDDMITFIHVKRHTQSSTLSHLFSQATNSWKHIMGSNDVRERFLHLVDNAGGDRPRVEDLLNARKTCIQYVITTHKDPERLEENLPIFSRIGAARTFNECRILSVPATIAFAAELRDPGAYDANDAVVEDD